MADNLINLRNRGRHAKEDERESPQSRDESESGGFFDEMFWEADESKKSEKQWYWYGGIVSISFLLIVIGVIARSFFFVIFIILAAALVMYYGSRRPRRVSFSLSEEGVMIGTKLHPYRDLKSFWIFDTRRRRELSLETKSNMEPFIVIPLGDNHPADVRSYLGEFLEEVEHMESVVEKFMRAIGI